MSCVERVTEASAWDEALLTLPNPHVLQSWTWGVIKHDQGWQAEHLLWHERSHIRAAAQILILRRGHLRLGYIPKGPLLDWDDMALVVDVLAHLEGFAREHKLILLKLDPDVRIDTPQGKVIYALLAARGWKASFEQVQFRNTMLLDLSPSLDVLMARMKSKWRYNIRLAIRKGVTVREAHVNELPELYEMYAETAARDNFVIREPAYYLDVWRHFMQVGLALPLVAEWDGALLAMAILLHFGSCIWYMYGASRALHRNVMPNHLLQWEAIRRAKALGCTLYDLWGAPNQLHKSDPMWGVYRFKLGFGTEFVPHIGAYDFSTRPLTYRLYGLLRPRVVESEHRRYWEQIRT